MRRRCAMRPRPRRKFGEPARAGWYDSRSSDRASTDTFLSASVEAASVMDKRELGIEQEQSYRNPLVERYASAEMSRIFSPYYKFTAWRRLWLALAEAESELGLPVSEAALADMRAGLQTIDLARADELEQRFRHDVMAHVHHFGEVAPAAKGVIHLGATSAFVTDNAELMQHRDALVLVRLRLLASIRALADFAREHRALPTLGYTHFQPAQPTTVR